MGYGNYSHAAHAALVADRASRSGAEVFTQRATHPLMNPQGLKVRESRDNADHPNSLGIVFALDVTGSMGDIPDILARRELPTFMKLLTDCGVTDPQLMFMAIGDANADHAALQVGQFETTAELMDQWLTRSYLEGGGGGTGEESYELAFYVLAQHTDLDCWVKRRKRGYLFMTGDELPYSAVSRHQIEALIGEKLDEDIPIEEAIAAAAETYHLFFLIPDAKRRQHCEKRWRELLGDHVICMDAPDDACAVAAGIVALTERAVPTLDGLAQVMGAHGTPRERVGAVVHALEGYAALIDPDAPKRVRAATAGASTARSSWWKRLFG
ncbi:VWA domain-containing protein [Variovorax sp. J22G21]|uniref:VWA domain-containing protein n=1 Tax=Variovorax fucosicus TaxID=3053517 RepID=UPI002578CBA2|nr:MULTISPECIES: VWA domain-containing protein [unclassified Variovorax]MDM0037768.1 VWA domain-containing protein [Variovorax sp. J22R193]MDM0056563.1 VWA domain-containing protein [Variovorax sp. J22G47]MDM0062544.1 VWA domain-containing protein [Variovorax sp. J22G21]